MNTTWSIISGGRLNRHQLTGSTTFQINTNDACETILLKTSTIKQSFEERLRRRLCTGEAPFPTSAPLCVEYASAVVLRESAWRHVELSVTIKDCENDALLWYFILMSPEEHISPGNLDEIVSLVADRLLQRMSGLLERATAHKFCP